MNFLSSAKKAAVSGIAAVVVFALGAILYSTGIIDKAAFQELFGGSLSSFSEQEAAFSDGNTRVHFIDTDQSDCILILTDDKTVLIDAAESGYGDKIQSYLSAQGVTDIDLFIATHPHSDHIGSAVSVFENFNVKEFMMPDIPDEYSPTTRMYEKMLLAAADEGCKMTLAKPGQTYQLDERTSLEILGPVNTYKEEYNNYSVISKLTCGAVSFLFTGDEEAKAEADLIASGADLSATVYKAGHHGSKTSSSPEFLAAVSPEYAVILCGANNDYGHPNDETLEALDEIGCKIYRTDLDGSIVFSTDGENLDIKKEK